MKIMTINILFNSNGRKSYFDFMEFKDVINLIYCCKNFKNMILDNYLKNIFLGYNNLEQMFANCCEIDMIYFLCKNVMNIGHLPGKKNKILKYCNGKTCCKRHLFGSIFTNRKLMKDNEDNIVRSSSIYGMGNIVICKHVIKSLIFNKNCVCSCSQFLNSRKYKSCIYTRHYIRYGGYLNQNDYFNVPSSLGNDKPRHAEIPRRARYLTFKLNGKYYKLVANVHGLIIDHNKFEKLCKVIKCERNTSVDIIKRKWREYFEKKRNLRSQNLAKCG